MSYTFYISLSMHFQNRKEAKKRKRKKEKTERMGHTCIVNQNSYSWDALYLLIEEVSYAAGLSSKWITAVQLLHNT